MNEKRKLKWFFKKFLKIFFSHFETYELSDNVECKIRLAPKFS